MAWSLASDHLHLLSHVATQFDLQIAEISTISRRRAAVRARALVSYAALRSAGLPARRVAPLLKVDPCTGSNCGQISDRKGVRG